MTPSLIITCVALYTLLLFAVVWYTSRNADNESYFRGNRSSKWFVVAYGMIGASLSGVTFISVPGAVYTSQLGYMQVVLGYLVGYFVIALILLPLYYRLNLTSIYTYLEQRFGIVTYKTGSAFFILSRVVGAALRMFIVINVLQAFVFDAMGVPFYVTVTLFIILILLYTYKGGVKTIVWTDMLQTTFMLLSLVLTVAFIASELGYGLGEVTEKVFSGKYSQMIFTEWEQKSFFPKQFFGGMFIAIAMTGLDQEMMQKNISCRNIREAQKNMITFSFILVLVNALFLALGALLYEYASTTGIALSTDAAGKVITDEVFPNIALNYLPAIIGIFFIIGIISAAYPSADGALTALTACFCIDILGMNKNPALTEADRTRLRQKVHIGFAVLLLAVIVIFKLINDQAVIYKVLTWAGYTYGPLLGLYAFGLFTRRGLRDRLAPLVCLAAPVACYFLDRFSADLFLGYRFGFELLIVNGALTFLGLYFISRAPEAGR
ncbi:MAG: sodium:solute symporter [Bacteroidota bacterium]